MTCLQLKARSYIQKQGHF